MGEISLSENLSFDWVRDSHDYSEGYDLVEHGKFRKGTFETGKEGEGTTGNADSLSFGYGLFEDNTTVDELAYSENQRKHEIEWLSDNGILDDLYLDVVSPPFQSCHEELRKLASILNEESVPAELEKTKPFVEIPPSLGILNFFGSELRELKGDKIEFPKSYAECRIPKKGGQKLSTGDILRLAGEKFVRSSSQKVDDLSILCHPFGFSMRDISEDEKRAVDLVRNLLASAEKIGQEKYKPASKILRQCEDSSSKAGTPVQRLVYYFSEALREKIDRETGKIISKGVGMEQQFDMDEEMMKPNSTIIAHHKQMPYCQISLYTAVQAIIENTADAKKVHVIDLQIRSGLQYTVLMQALAARFQYPIEVLKITAVGTKSKETIEKTGEWLTSFAHSMNLPFSFNIVMVSDMLDLKRDLFEIEDDETVAVYSSFLLRTIIAKQDRIESLMRVLSDMNPCVLAVIEVEANHASPVFVKRFIESLFFFGAYFDCLGDCMDSDDPHRLITESMYFGEGIRNIVAAESNERTIMHVNIRVWRSFFARFGMIEQELSTASLYQASLLAKHFPCWSSCSFAMDEKCLTVGWKGTPLVSISAWKFVQRELDQC